MNWHRTTESNREPSALEAAALPIELARYGWWVRMDCLLRSAFGPRRCRVQRAARIEQTTVSSWETALQAAAIGLSATHPLMAPRARFERATSGFVDRRS
jgi:hypothetical protein